MIEVRKAADLAPHVGSRFGPGAWLVVSQAMIDRFAEATGDRQWIHVDVARAARELPGGRTIAHGALLLSLLPQLGAGLLVVTEQSRALHYGIDRVRFLCPVPAGSRVRAVQTLHRLEPQPGGARLFLDSTVEIEGVERPALVARTIRLSFD